MFGLGRWWTVLSASWLHGNLLHILFNMMWVRDLGPATADVIGPARTVVVYVVAGVCGFTLSSCRAAVHRPPAVAGRRRGRHNRRRRRPISVCWARSCTTAG